MKVDRIDSLETAVVILCFNGKTLMEELLPIAIQHTSLDERTQLIVVDNASTDNSVDWLTKNYPEIPLIQLDTNYGFAGGYNKGLELIGAEYYVLLSSDVEVAENWLDPLIEGMKADKAIGACQPKVRSYHKRQEFEYAGAAGGFVDSWGVPFCRGRIFSYSEVDKGQYDDVKEIFWASGCCFAVRSEAWQETGGLDTDFFAHMEEIDLCWRMQGMKYKIMAFPESRVYHMGGQTLSYDNPKKLYLNCRNNYAMLVKNAPNEFLYFKLPFKFIIDWFGAVYFLVKKGPSSFMAIIRGQIHFLLRLSHWKKKRNQTQRRPQKDIKGIYSNSIIKQSFMLGKNTFSSLKDLK